MSLSEDQAEVLKKYLKQCNDAYRAQWQHNGGATLDAFRYAAVGGYAAVGVFMGPHYQSQNSFGPAGMMQRSGLGTAKAAQTLAPEEFCVEALIGWRRWSVTMFGDELLSNIGTRWIPYEALKAECKVAGGCSGVACVCGIYAYKVRADAESGENAPTALTHVWGEVALWGRVVEHARGFRAQFAYPKSFVKTGGIAEQLARVYGVKVIS